MSVALGSLGLVHTQAVGYGVSPLLGLTLHQLPNMIGRRISEETILTLTITGTALTVPVFTQLNRSPVASGYP
eukprot:4348448-Amphidinium_carterae.2